ncbi:unnamed protein product [Rotaria socialis]
MRKVILYTAVSIGGFIAREDGNIDWLSTFDDGTNDDHDYKLFYENIDVTLMGNKTYQQVLTFPVPFPYPDKKNYVFSHEKQKSNEFVEFVNDDIYEFINHLKKQPGKDIWLVGGAQLNQLLLSFGLIDEIIMTIIPIALGKASIIIKMNSTNFNHLLEAVKKTAFEDDKVDLIETTIRSNRIISSSQVVQLMKLIPFDDGKLAVAKTAYRYAYDQGSYPSVVSGALIFSDAKEELNKYIRQH